jgi:type I restriction enzyme M protein
MEFCIKLTCVSFPLVGNPSETKKDSGQARMTKDKTECVTKEVSFTLAPKDDFAKLFEKKVKEVFADKIKALTKDIKDTGDKNKAIKSFINSLEVNAEVTHRHYVSDNEYIQYGEDIEEFLKREIGKQIIRWQDSPQLGYEILPNKYFYKYQPPKAADEILQEFWKLESEAEAVLKGLMKST